MIIRPARREDCLDIARMIATASDGLAEYIWSRVAEGGERALEAGVRRLLRKGVPFSYENCFVADLDNRTIGLLHAYPMSGPKEAPALSGPLLRPFLALTDINSLYVSAIFVAPKYRGCGLGVQLLQTADQRADTLRLPRLSLIVLQHNEVAMRFYQRRGFREIERHPLVPQPAVPLWTGDAVLLVRPLELRT